MEAALTGQRRITTCNDTDRVGCGTLFVASYDGLRWLLLLLLSARELLFHYSTGSHGGAGLMAKHGRQFVHWRCR